MTTRIAGIDVSGNNGGIDWSVVASTQNRFAYIKATEGETFVDARFAANFGSALASGLYVGAYHFARPDHQNDPEDEADHFCSVVPWAIQQPQLRMALDIEVKTKLLSVELETWCRRFLERVEQQTNRTPMVYTSHAYIHDHLGDCESLKRFPLWVARVGAAEVGSVAPWDKWTIWQHSWKGDVPGIHGQVDLDWFDGSLDDLHAMAST